MKDRMLSDYILSFIKDPFKSEPLHAPSDFSKASGAISCGIMHAGGAFNKHS